MELRFLSTCINEKGVQQGDSLSPTLFICYIEDLSEALETCGLDLDHRFYADDLEVDSPEPKAIQQSLDTLSGWCDGNDVSVNTQKTKMMKIRRGGKLPKNTMFTYKEKEIEIANSYEYLGLTIQPTATLTFT